MTNKVSKGKKNNKVSKVSKEIKDKAIEVEDDIKEAKPIKEVKKIEKKAEKKFEKTVTIGKSKGNFWSNNKGLIIFLGILALLIALTFLIEGDETTKKEIDYSTLGSDIQEWYTDTQSNNYTLTVIALSYCGYCAQYKPIITQIANDEGLKLYWFEMDTMSSEDANALQNTYTLEQYSGSSPYTAIIYGGKFVTDTVGYMDESSTNTFLKEAGAIN